MPLCFQLAPVEEVEDDGVSFASKIDGLIREFATGFHESEKRHAAMRDNMQTLGFAFALSAAASAGANWQLG